MIRNLPWRRNHVYIVSSNKKRNRSVLVAVANTPNNNTCKGNYWPIAAIITPTPITTSIITLITPITTTTSTSSITKRFIHSTQQQQQQQEQQQQQVDHQEQQKSPQNEQKQFEQKEQQQQQSDEQLGLFRLFQQDERIIFKEQRQLLNESRQLAQQVSWQSGGGIVSSSIQSSNSTSNSNINLNSGYYLDELGTFSVVVTGEYNSGKSTLINALLGTKLVECGSLPTTDTITIISSPPPIHHNNILENNNNNNNNNNKDTNNADNDESATTINNIINNDDNNTNINNHDDKTILSTSNTNNHTTKLTTTNATTNVQEIYGPGYIHYIVPDVLLLNDLTIVDTPGTNAIIEDHTKTTIQLIPNADLILFVTSADRPMSNSEKQLLHSICTMYNKSIIIIINKMDILESTGGSYGTTEKDTLIQFVTDHVSTIVGARPVIIPISARDALAAKLNFIQQNKQQSTTVQQQPVIQQTSAAWERSNFIQLEKYLQETLTTKTKIKSKLSSPIGTIELLMNESISTLQQQQLLLNDDLLIINVLQNQFTTWEKELLYDFQYYTNEIISYIQTADCNRYNILLYRSSSIIELLFIAATNQQQLQQMWDKTKSIIVHSNSTTIVPTTTTTTTNNNNSYNDSNDDYRGTLLRIVSEMADTIATRGRSQGQSVIEFLGKRGSSSSSTTTSIVNTTDSTTSSLIGTVSAASQYDTVRTNLNTYITNAINKHIPNNNEKIVLEQQFLQQLHSAGIVSLSTGTVALLSLIGTVTQSIDIMIGISITISFSIPCLYIITGYYPQRIVSNYTTNASNYIQYLQDDLSLICTKEQQRIQYKLQQNGILPYTNSIQIQSNRINDLLQQCNTILSKSKLLRKRINKL